MNDTITFQFTNNMEMQEGKFQKLKVIVAVTGSVAALKLPELLKLLLPTFNIKLITSDSSKKFINLEEIREMVKEKHIEWYCDEDELLQWTTRGDPVLHIQLRKWADMLLITPLSANTLAKISSGICDNLVSLVFRCWNMKLREKNTEQNNFKSNKLLNPIVVCPAMNTMMWEHPITSEQLGKLKGWGVTIVDPVEKVLICGDQGKGAMAHLSTIVETTISELKHLMPQVIDKKEKLSLSNS